MSKRDHSYINDENWVSHIFFLRIKGTYRIPGSAEKGGASVLCHI